MKPQINKLLTISATHISAKTAEFLDIETTADIEDFTFHVYAKNNSGWFIYVPKDILYSIKKERRVNFPEDLIRCLQYMNDMKCNMLCIAYDGPEIEYLPVYEEIDINENKKEIRL